MADSTPLDVSAKRTPSAQRDEGSRSDRTPDRRLCRWGGVAALGGVLLMVGTAVVVGVLGLPDASDVETLTDFADIETGRIFEHFFYLGAVVMFALHALALHRLLVRANPAATSFVRQSTGP